MKGPEMRRLSAAFTKTVPGEENFSSRRYFASVDFEIEDGAGGDEVTRRIRSAFNLVRTEVEQQIEGKVSSETSAPQTIPSFQPRNGSITEKQVAFIRSLASQQGLTPEALGQKIFTIFGTESLEALDRREASSLVTELKRNGNKISTAG